MSFIDRVQPRPRYRNLLKIQSGRDLASPSRGAGMQIQQSIRVPTVPIRFGGQRPHSSTDGPRTSGPFSYCSATPNLRVPFATLASRWMTPSRWRSRRKV